MAVRRLVFALSMGLCGALAHGQAAPGGPLAALRTKSDLSDEDRAAVREFLTQRVADLIGQDAATARDASRALRAAAKGSEGFRRAYTQESLALLAPAIAKAELLPATQLLLVLDELDSLEAIPTFIAALSDSRVGVRAAAALAIKNLRPKLTAAGGDSLSSAIAAIRDAAKKEPGRDALRVMYEALDFGRGADRAAAAALADVLDARGKLHADGADVPAVGADAAGLRIAAEAAGALSDDDKRKAAAAAGAIMRFALNEYLSPPQNLIEVRSTDSAERVERRNAIEQVILAGEKSLAALLAPGKAPSVYDAIRKLNRPETRLQWKEWNELLKRFTNQEFTLPEESAQP